MSYHHDPWSGEHDKFDLCTVIFLAEKFENSDAESFEDILFSDEEMSYLDKVQADKRLPQWFGVKV